jgi:hypothetical protein
MVTYSGRSVAEAFVQLPDVEEYPEYYTVVTNPIDLASMQVCSLPFSLPFSSLFPPLVPFLLVKRLLPTLTNRRRQPRESTTQWGSCGRTWRCWWPTPTPSTRTTRRSSGTPPHSWYDGSRFLLMCRNTSRNLLQANFRKLLKRVLIYCTSKHFLSQ